MSQRVFTKKFELDLFTHMPADAVGGATRRRHGAGDGGSRCVLRLTSTTMQLRVRVTCYSRTQLVYCSPGRQLRRALSPNSCCSCCCRALRACLPADSIIRSLAAEHDGYESANEGGRCKAGHPGARRAPWRP